MIFKSLTLEERKARAERACRRFFRETMLDMLDSGMSRDDVKALTDECLYEAVMARASRTAK